jgi:hypothetical protein
MARDLLVVSGGHPYEVQPFADLLASLNGWTVTHLLHPEAERLIAEGRAAQAEALLFYDMPGHCFAEGRVTSRVPSGAFRRAILSRFDAGRGAVAMHHALAGWAEWPEWHDLLGGCFLYRPTIVRGQLRPDSGYRHDVNYTAEVIADHPVTAGLPASFSVVDELYLAEMFEGDFEPLVRARHDFVRDEFYSAAAAVAGRMFDNAGWEHPPGSNCIAWVKSARNAPLVYLQPGDGPATYANPHFRRLLANSVQFIATSGPAESA